MWVYIYLGSGLRPPFGSGGGGTLGIAGSLDE